MNEKTTDKTARFSIRNIPKDTLRGIGVLATTQDMSKSEYIRVLLDKHVKENLPENMIERL